MANHVEIAIGVGTVVYLGLVVWTALRTPQDKDGYIILIGLVLYVPLLISVGLVAGAAVWAFESAGRLGLVGTLGLCLAAYFYRRHSKRSAAT